MIENSFSLVRISHQIKWFSQQHFFLVVGYLLLLMIIMKFNHTFNTWWWWWCVLFSVFVCVCLSINSMFLFYLLLLLLLLFEIRKWQPLHYYRITEIQIQIRKRRKKKADYLLNKVCVCVFSFLSLWIFFGIPKFFSRLFFA